MNVKTIRRIYISSSVLALGLFIASFGLSQAASEQKSTPTAAALSASSSLGPSILPSQQTNTLTTTSSSGTSTTKTDEIYIDDEAQEGSGDRGGGIHDDLEKDDEDDYSGSGDHRGGYGNEDDEDHSVERGRNRGSGASGSSGTNSGSGSSGGSRDRDTLSGSGDGPGDTDDEDLWTTYHPKEHAPEISHEKPDIHTGTDVHKGISSSEDNELGLTEDDDVRQRPGSEDANRPTDRKKSDSDSGSFGGHGNEVLIMDPKQGDRTTSFFAQPGILAGMYIAVIGGAVVGLLCAILVVMFIVYRMRKKDEGSYALDEPKRSPTANTYAKSTHNREFYA